MTSEPESELFEFIFEKLDIRNKTFYGKNQFFRVFKEIGRTFSYDFVYNKKIIEFINIYK